MPQPTASTEKANSRSQPLRIHLKALPHSRGMEKALKVEKEARKAEERAKEKVKEREERKARQELSPRLLGYRKSS